MLMQKQLTSLGCRWTKADNSRAALSELARIPYDFVLMDLHMPDVDGVTAIKQIRAGQAGAATLTAVTGAHLNRALDDLLDSAQGVTRTLLGVGVDPATLPAGGALAMSPARMMMQRRTGVIRAYRG